ncbi:MAG: DUF4864 domain-containing protein [Rubellimicrobium sp.]|nr:DUF4864 domain-containing protein [Rubellimicrobium sp.]
MKRLLAALLTLWALSGPLSADDATDIRGVISNQLDAFNDRDVDGAFAYASPAIKGMFGSPQNFGRMVEQGYPMVWSNSDVQFLDLRDEGGRLTQRVMMRDPSGARHVLDYQMIQTGDGWQINGVWIVPMPDVGA